MLNALKLHFIHVSIDFLILFSTPLFSVFFINFLGNLTNYKFVLYQLSSRTLFMIKLAQKGSINSTIRLNSQHMLYTNVSLSFKFNLKLNIHILRVFVFFLQHRQQNFTIAYTKHLRNISWWEITNLFTIMFIKM